MEVMMNNSTAVIIGRFQPVHNGHINIFKKAQQECKSMIVLVGSANAHRSTSNPFSFEERKEMIMRSLGKVTNVAVLPINDYPYDECAWTYHVQKVVNTICREDKSFSRDVVLYGHTKDNSSYYLKSFGNWKYVEVKNYEHLHATDIRSAFFGSNVVLRGCIPETVADYMVEYMDTENFNNRVQEFKYISEYKKQYESLKYPVIHVTVDSVVHCLGHVLLVERSGNPGMGQYALPGGFLDEFETIKDGILRELKEETKIDVPPGKLKNSLSHVNVFDNPGRSLRGRTITHAGLIDLMEFELPKVKGGSDANRAMWVSLDKLDYLSRKNMIFEDHYHIIRKMLRNVETI